MTYFHEEQRFGRWVWALVVLVFVVVVFAAVAAPSRTGTLAGLGIGLFASLLVFVLLVFSRLDVDVDQQAIHIAFHLLWPTRHIALTDVRRAHATKYEPLAWGGWGVHYMFLKGWLFNTGGHEGVLVETNSGGNVMIGSQRAAELEAAIAKAIAALPKA